MYGLYDLVMFDKPVKPSGLLAARDAACSAGSSQACSNANTALVDADSQATQRLLVVGVAGVVGLWLLFRKAP